MAVAPDQGMFMMVDFASILDVQPEKFAVIADGPESRGQATQVRMRINPDPRVTPHWRISKNSGAPMLALLRAPEKVAAHD
jgi:hypothetical protein